jgi:hypothetical protein
MGKIGARAKPLRAGGFLSISVKEIDNFYIVL